MPMLLNYCKFLENGGLESGYLLKPSWMLHDSTQSRTTTSFIDVLKEVKIHVLFG
jgi:hypothetical protein